MVVMGTREGAVDAGKVLWTRRPKVFRHSEGCASNPWDPPVMGRAASSALPRWNQPGDSRAERENDSRI